MKKLIIIFLILFAVNSYATTYYVSQSTGNDSNNGLTTGTAWKTLAKVNATSFNPGDIISFNGGDTFYGSLVISNSGSSGNPITYNSYGTGNAIITGFTTVSTWSNFGGNIWQSTSAVSSLSTCNMVSINGVNTGMGRYPNTGYLPYQSHSGNTSITSSSLSGTPNWTGATVAIKERRYVIETGLISAQSSGTLTYSNGAAYSPTDGFGLFIQNDVRTLDTLNEWYYDPSAKKISVYETSSPTNVLVASTTNNITVSGNYITISNLNFTGANGDAIAASGNYITVQNCNISFAGQNGFKSSYSTNATVNNNSVSYCNDNGIALGSNCINAIVTNNTLKGIGVIPGMTQVYSYGTLSILGNNSLVQYNIIDSSGYNGITFQGTNSKVLNNLINHSCLIKDDGGGIYSAQSMAGRQIIGNIILNTDNTVPQGIGTTDVLGGGIYLDSYSSNFLVQGNTVANGGSTGLFLSNLDSNVIRDNTLYNNSLQVIGFNNKAQMMVQHICCNVPTKNTLRNNISFTGISSRYNSYVYTGYAESINGFTDADSSFYVNLIGNDLFLGRVQSASTTYSFSAWQSATGWDSNSKDTVLSTGTMDSVMFVYNATQSTVPTTLPFKYMDVRNVIYNGSITLAPYTSSILIYKGATTGVTPPVVNAGSNQIIYLPATSTTMSGTVTPASGHTATYLWSTISGGGTPVFSDITILNPVITALTIGSHVFRLTATQDDSQTGYANVTVTVNNPTSQTWINNIPKTFVNH